MYYSIIMETVEHTHLQVCPIEAVSNLIGGKWKVIIINHLLTHGTLPFSALRKKTPDITQKMVSGM